MKLQKLDLKRIDWNHVTKFSQLIAVILFVGVFALGFWLGQVYEFRAFQHAILGSSNALSAPQEKPIATATYFCDGDKTIRALYFKARVDLELSDKRTFGLPQAVSADGARFANTDGSFVFWNKGTTAFITEGTGKNAPTTYANCVAKPTPV